MRALKSYACGEWIEGSGKGAVVENAVTGEAMGSVSTPSFSKGGTRSN